MVKKIDEQGFRNEAEKDAVAVVDFSATWCGPCKMLAPVIEQVSEQLGDKVKFYNVDVDDAPELAGEFGINSVPSVLLLKNGRLVDQSVGFRPGPALKSWIEGNL
ncbi:MAG: thioredoxin [Clostridiales bacterium]|jgi:thioredoxin 1|nr:thioredoxin [Clostridiales bacterium]